MSNITPAMQKALDFAKDNNGAVFAGKTATRHGSVIEFKASVLQALERRGLVTISIGPDGGMMATLVQEAK